MRDGGVSEQPTHVRLRERHEIAEQDRQRSEDGEHGRPTGEHRVPVGASTSGRKTNQHNFSKDNERSDFRTGSDESCAGNRRALISVRRPKMKWRGGDLEGETDQGHDDADGEKWLNRTSR